MASFLVVDDDPPTVMAMARLLIGDGHHVSAFTSGAEALDALTRRTFDVVVTDLEMPGVRGTEIVRAVHERLPEACVVVVTARGRGMEKALLDAGASFVTDKPVDYDRLTSAVGAWMEGARSSFPERVRVPRDRGR